MRSYYPAPGTGTRSRSPNSTLFFDNLHGKRFWTPFRSQTRTAQRPSTTSPTLTRLPTLLGGLRSRFGIGSSSPLTGSPPERPKTLNISSLHSPSNVSPSKSVTALRNFFRRRKVTFSPPLLQRSRSRSAFTNGYGGQRSPSSPSPTFGIGGGGSGSCSRSRTPSPILKYRGSGGSGMRPVSASAAVSGTGGAAPGSSGMDWKQNISNDHTDIAYREAVSRLRSILSPRPSSAQGQTQTRKENLGSDSSPPTKLRKDRLRRFFSPPRATDALNNMTSAYNRRSGGLGGGQHSTSTVDQDDLFDFIEKQSAYISQLEKEAQVSRTDLGTVLAHVRQIITENESLHERQKQDLFSSMIRQLDDKTGGSHGASQAHQQSHSQSQVIRDSRVAEMDALLNQTKRALRAAQEEILELRRGGATKSGGAGASGGGVSDSTAEAYAAKIEALTRDKDVLVATLTRLKEQIGELRDRESEATRKVKSSLEVVEQMQMEKAASDTETRRVKEELDRHQQRIRDLIQDHSRKIYEEKLHVENKYRQELDLLNNEMSAEMDALTKARVDLERQKRVEAELRRELGQRVTGIEDLRQELGLKISHLQSELQLALTQKGHAEQELCMARLGAEKADRDAKHEIGRLNAEVQALRKRTEEADSDLLRCQEVVAKLNANMQQMQHENAKARIRLEERGIAVPVTSTVGGGDSGGGNSAAGDVMLMSSMIQAMEDKHSKDMNELEQLVQCQNGLLDKLRAECKLLTEKLESTSQEYNKEKHSLSAEKERLTLQVRAATSRYTDLQRSLEMYKSGQAQMTERLHSLEEDDKTRSDRIFQLLSKQSGLLRENQSLQSEVALLKTKIKAHAQSLRFGDDDNDDHVPRTTVTTARTSTSKKAGNRGIH